MPIMIPRAATSLALLLLVLHPGALHAADAPLAPEISLPQGAREISATEALKLVQEQQISILDIRTAPEIKEQGRISGSKHLDFLREDFDEILISQIKLPLDKPCLVYCAIGGRSRRAAQRLASLGFKNILVLKDGFNAWKAAGQPVEHVK